jgi:hypothetical protein
LNGRNADLKRIKMEQARKAKKEGGGDLKYKNGSERMEEEAKTAGKGVRRDEEENEGKKKEELEVRELGMEEGGIVMKGKAEMRKGRGMTRMGRWLWMMMLIWRLLFCGGF